MSETNPEEVVAQDADDSTDAAAATPATESTGADSETAAADTQE